MIKQVLLILMIFFIGIFSSHSQDKNCDILKDSRLKNLQSLDTTSYIVINNDRHIEYVQNGKYYIKSNLDWLSDCE